MSKEKKMTWNMKEEHYLECPHLIGKMLRPDLMLASDTCPNECPHLGDVHIDGELEGEIFSCPDHGWWMVREEGDIWVVDINLKKVREITY